LISDSLTYIFNQAIALCIFPHEWKIARVIPLFKNGKRDLLGNCRPISVLPAISKVMERILHTQLYEYLTANNLYSLSINMVSENFIQLPQLGLIVQMIGTLTWIENCLIWLYL
jgi:hypothetical protein